LPEPEKFATIAAARTSLKDTAALKRVSSIGATLCCLFALARPLSLQAAAPAFQLDDLKRLVNFSGASISPDGRQVAVIVSTPDWNTDKAQQTIELFDVASGAHRTLTWKRSGIASPKWSEDGTRLAFLAEDASPPNDEKRPQIFVMPMDGGDAIRLTETAKGVDEFAWSPDGSRIAFITANEAPNADAIKHHNDVFKVTDNHFLTRTPLTPWHLWVIPSAGGAPRRLTDGAFSLQTDQQDSVPVPQWSRDGHRIAFTQFPGPYWGPSFHSVISSVDADSATLNMLETAETSNTPAYAPGGDDVRAWLRPRDGDQNNGNAVYVRADGHVLDVTRALDRNIDAYRWLPEGRELLLQGVDGSHATLWRQPLSGPARALALGDVEASPDFSVARNGAVAFIGSTSTHPEELYVMESLDASPRRLSNLNAFADQLAAGRTESIEWRGPQGFTEDGVLTYPVGFQPKRQYPLVLLLHGGPTSASTLKFKPLPQLLAAAGFIVFQPNYRGSNNLGDRYQHAIFRDTGAGPGNDVMAGLSAVEKLGIVDQNRIGISGWSYGGYMTTWLTGHSRIWKAAVAGAALTDWVMDYTVSYYQQGDAYLFGGSPWDPRYRDIWRDQSPIKYAGNVTAPTLIMGDVEDPNVPLINSYEWFHALRDAGVTVEFYAYPVDTHFPEDVVRTSDVYRRWVAWMTERLR
jgi:dipeptidyl aminopeptidase/acylaminoacyl peptidase